MSEKRRDNRNRILRTGESQRKDGRYAYKYIDTFGNPQFVYAWKLVPTDKTPAGKREDISLREKEKEIQKLVHSVDTTNAGLRDEAAKTYQEVKKQLSDVDSAIRQIEVENVRNTGEDEKSNEAFSSVLDDDEAKAIAEITETSDGRDSEEENTYYDRNKRNDNSSNSNSEIIALYKKGISILEISKMLSIGQGEVKLVVDLYNAR